MVKQTVEARNPDPRTRALVCRTEYHSRKFRAIAFHEAGHAVFAVLYGFRFSEVRIHPEIHPVPHGGAVLGEVVFERGWPAWAYPGNLRFDQGRATKYCEADACMTLAGPLAESRYTGRLPVTLLGGIAKEGSDAECIDVMADMLGMTPGVKSEWTARLSFITLEMLHDCAIWAAVTIVAEELFHRQSLAWHEVASIVQSTCGVMTGHRNGVHALVRNTVSCGRLKSC
jgi:hypothetical protein